MSDKSGLFPLEIVDFEEYMLVDDANDYPMVIPGKLEFDGLLDRTALERSLDLLLDENPLLRATIEEVSGKFYWVEGPRCQIEWTDEFPNLIRIDLKTQTGLKVMADDRDGKTTIKFFIHHSVTDGGGITFMLDRWFAHYQAVLNGVNEAEPSFDRERSYECIRQRGRFGMNWFKYLLRPIQEFSGAVGVLEYFSHRPVALGAQSDAVEPDPSIAAPLTHRYATAYFSEQESQQILRNAKSLGHKVNDLMIAAMYEACYQWLEENQPDESHRHIRIMIPMDMRSKKSLEPFVGNKVSMIFLDRRPGRYKSLNGICRLVWLEMTTIKLMKLGLTFVHLIHFFRWRKALRKLLRRDRSVATTILSNMGPLFVGSKFMETDQCLHIGNVKLRRFEVYPPIRPYTWFTSVVTTYGKQIAFHAAWCSKNLNKSDMDAISSRFKSNLLEGFSKNGS